MTQKSLKITGIALVILILLIPPVSAELQTINTGATVFIGESGLDITNAVGNNTAIAWWTPAADIHASAPAKVLKIGDYVARFGISDSEFTGHTGNWYQYDETRPINAGPLAFTVADPTLDIQIIDADTQVDVTGREIPPDSYLSICILTNQYAALDPVQRPNANPATDGYITVKMIDDTGNRYTMLYDTLAISPPLGNLTVDKVDWRWGGSSQYSWNTNSTDGPNVRRYPYGVYSMSARSNLNGLSNNYKNAGSDYTGKTVTDTKVVIVNSPNHVVIEEKGVSLVEQAAQEKAALAANITQKPQNVVQLKTTLIPDPHSMPNLPAGNQVGLSDIQSFLTEWNEKMHWGFSTSKIKSLSKILEDDALKKYKISQESSYLMIPDMKPFCFEMGDAIGLTKNQSEEFAIAADDALRRAKITSNHPPSIPTIYNDINATKSFKKSDIEQRERDLRTDRVGEVGDDHLELRQIAPGGVPLLHGKTPGGDLARETVVQIFAERMVQFDRMHNRTLVNEGAGECLVPRSDFKHMASLCLCEKIFQSVKNFNAIVIKKYKTDHS